MAQNGALTPGVAAPAKTTARSMALLLGRGEYDTVISRATQALESAGNNPAMLYFRGYANYTLGFYDLARRDLSTIGDFAPYEGWKIAGDMVRQIDRLQALAPALVTEIQVQGRVVFQVFYDEINSWSSAVMELLPRAYEINRDFLGRDPAPTSVWIFADQKRYKQFMALQGDNTPVSWLWAGGGTAGVYFCQNLPKMSPQDTKSAYFRSTVVHETNHYAVRRVAGNVAMPPWFVEGLAMATAQSITPEETARYGRDFEKAWRSDALLSFQEVNDRAFFQSVVERGLASKTSASPYAQGWSMTQHFLSLVPPAQVTPFLEEVRRTREFNQALLRFTGLTPQQFFENWHAGVAFQPAPQPAPQPATTTR